jgi:hypothetical protein
MGVRKYIKFLIPSQGRGAVDGVMAGRGIFAMLAAETPPYTLPLGGDRTGHRFFDFAVTSVTP